MERCWSFTALWALCKKTTDAGEGEREENPGVNGVGAGVVDDARDEVSVGIQTLGSSFATTDDAVIDGRDGADAGADDGSREDGPFDGATDA